LGQTPKAGDRDDIAPVWRIAKLQCRWFSQRATAKQYRIAPFVFQAVRGHGLPPSLGKISAQAVIIRIAPLERLPTVASVCIKQILAATLNASRTTASASKDVCATRRAAVNAYGPGTDRY
jgi:hypothetical protein